MGPSFGFHNAKFVIFHFLTTQSSKPPNTIHKSLLNSSRSWTKAQSLVLFNEFVSPASRAERTVRTQALSLASLRSYNLKNSHRRKKENFQIKFILIFMQK